MEKTMSTNMSSRLIDHQSKNGANKNKDQRKTFN